MLIISAIVLLPAIVLALMYNHLVGLRNRVRESWSNVDTELKRRYDLIPNLVETVKAYAAHERETLQRVVEARARAVASTGRPASQATDENALIKTLNGLLAVVERYPELKAGANFLKLQEELAETEDRIQAARRFYNGNVRDYENTRQSVPTNLVAALFGFVGTDFFEIGTIGMRAAPKAAF